MKKLHIARKKNRKKIIEDSWNLDNSFCNWIIPRLKQLRDKSFGYPGCLDITCKYQGTVNKDFVDTNNLNEYFNDDEDEPGNTAWKKILSEMITGFEEYREKSYNIDFDYSKTQNSLRFFKLFFRHLWD